MIDFSSFPFSPLSSSVAPSFVYNLLSIYPTFFFRIGQVFEMFCLLVGKSGLDSPKSQSVSSTLLLPP